MHYGIILVFTISSFTLATPMAAQESPVCTRTQEEISQSTPKSEIVYQALRYAGFTQICNIVLTVGCNDTCQCAYTTFSFLQDVNPTQKEALAAKWLDFMDEYYEVLNCYSS